MAPSVNCSLDEIDLNALKVLIRIDNIFIILIIFFFHAFRFVLDNFNFGFCEFDLRGVGGEMNADKS